MSKKFVDKVVLVIGGSVGIGLVLVKVLVEQGVKVYIIGCCQEELDVVVRFIGFVVCGICVDVVVLSDFDVVFVIIVEEFGWLDVLFVNVGGGDMLLLSVIIEVYVDWIFVINVCGVVFIV